MKSEEDVVRSLYTHAADLLKNGVSEKDLKRDLEEHGLDSESAKAVIRNLAAVKIEQRRKQGKKYMSYGALWCIGGTVVTLLTYTAASGGGTYLVTWGAVLFGATQFLIGLFLYAMASIKCIPLNRKDEPFV